MQKGSLKLANKGGERERGVATHLDAIVAQYGLAIVQPVDIVHRMARDNALELCILVHINGLHLRLQMRCQRS